MDHTIPTTNTTPVGFYRGLNENLNKLSGYKDGAFYVTTDTNNLYYAKSSTELVQLNKSIQVVDAFPASPKLIGEFYYNYTTSQLAYYAGKIDGVAQWIHVNYYENTSVKSITVSDAVSDSTGLTFNLSLQQQNRNGTDLGDALTDSFKITKEQINALVIHPDIPDLGDIQVTLGAAVSNGTATVSLGGKGSASSNNSFTITGADDVTVDGADNAITISAKSYEITNKTGTDDAAEAAITLKNSDNAANGKISFTDDGKDIVITATDGAINVAHKTYSGTSKDGADLTTGTVANGGTITVVKGVDLSNGHVTGIRTSSFILPTIPDDKYATAVSADNTGEIIITMNQDSVLKSGKNLYYTINNHTVYNQGDLTDDIKDIIEKNLAKVTNAMTFKGSLTGGSTRVDAKDISELVTFASIGDVYIVKSGFISVADFADDEDIAGIGDMIIASSSDDTEADDGVIPSEKLIWTVIEGTESDTTYTLTAAGNKITLTPDNGSEQHIMLAGDDIVSISSANIDGDTDQNGKVSVSHKTYVGGIDEKLGAAEKQLAFGDTAGIDVIVGYDDDGYGHVEKLYKTKLTIPALPDQTNDHTLSAAYNIIKLSNGENQDQGSIKISGDSAILIDTIEDKDADCAIRIAHKMIRRTDSDVLSGGVLNDGDTFTAITGILNDANGHITGTTTVEYEIQDTTYTLSGANAVSIGDNKVIVTDYLHTADNQNAGSSSFILSSQTSNLTISPVTDEGSTNEIQFNLVWGTF